MIVYTQFTRIKSFVAALSLLFSALFILNFARLDVPSKMKVKDGDSVVTLKNLYSTLTRINFSEMKVFQWIPDIQKISSNKEGTFYMEHK